MTTEETLKQAAEKCAEQLDNENKSRGGFDSQDEIVEIILQTLLKVFADLNQKLGNVSLQGIGLIADKDLLQRELQTLRTVTADLVKDRDKFEDALKCVNFEWVICKDQLQELRTLRESDAKVFAGWFLKQVMDLHGCTTGDCPHQQKASALMRA